MKSRAVYSFGNSPNVLVFPRISRPVTFSKKITARKYSSESDRPPLTALSMIFSFRLHSENALSWELLALQAATARATAKSMDNFFGRIGRLLLIAALSLQCFLKDRVAPLLASKIVIRVSLLFVEQSLLRKEPVSIVSNVAMSLRHEPPVNETWIDVGAIRTPLSTRSSVEKHQQPFG
jgi:hypothetical protein